MLYVHVNEKIENYIYNVEGKFFRTKKKDWFNREDVKEVIKGIDNTIAVKDEYLENPKFGAISPMQLSTGCKSVILMIVQDKPVYATHCGDNCAKYILKAAEKKDIHIVLHHCLNFAYNLDPWNVTFDAMFVDSGKITHTYREYVFEYYRIRKGED